VSEVCDVAIVVRRTQEFLTTLQQRFPAKDAKIIIACDIGGLLSTNTTRLIASNSFETLFFLQNLGHTNVKVDTISTRPPRHHPKQRSAFNRRQPLRCIRRDVKRNIHHRVIPSVGQSALGLERSETKAQVG